MAAPEAGRPMKRPRTSVRFASGVLLLLILVLPAIGAEGYLRHLGLGYPIVYLENTSYRYAPAPNQRVPARDGPGFVTIDGAGLRGTGDWARAADHHILFIGDSVTWGGTSLDDADTFAARTCVELEAAIGGTAACGNGGVNGYGIDNMIARIVDDPATARADTIVAVVISLDAYRGLNDLHRTPFFSFEPHGPLRASWEAIGYLTLLAGNWLVHPGATDAYYPPTYYPAGDGRAVANRTTAHLLAVLAAEARQDKRVLVVFSPIMPELEDAADLPYTQAVRGALVSRMVPYLDLIPAVRAQQPAKDFYVDGVHLTARGHRVYAAAIAARLAQMLGPTSHAQANRP
jgi:lysophospholipase L1-like esterase